MVSEEIKILVESMINEFVYAQTQKQKKWKHTAQSMYVYAKSLQKSLEKSYGASMANLSEETRNKLQEIENQLFDSGFNSVWQKNPRKVSFRRGL